MIDHPNGTEERPTVSGVAEELRRLVRERLGDRFEPPRRVLDEGARAWAIGPAPRPRRR